MKNGEPNQTDSQIGNLSKYPSIFAPQTADEEDGTDLIGNA